MARNAIILILLCVLAGAIHFAWQEFWGIDATKNAKGAKICGKVADASPSPDFKWRAVCASNDIQKGTIIQSNDVKLIEIDGPSFALENVSEAIGKKAIHSMKAGQGLTYNDIQSPNYNPWSYRRSAR